MSGGNKFAERLLERATGDLHVLERLWDDSETPAWTLGFHAQQAVEKSIKAVLAASEIEYPRTHNLALLLELSRRNQLSLPSDFDEFFRLTAYGAAFRYEDELDGEFHIFDRKWALNSARRAVQWASETLKKQFPPIND